MTYTSEVILVPWPTLTPYTPYIQFTYIIHSHILFTHTLTESRFLDRGSPLSYGEFHNSHEGGDPDQGRLPC